MITDFHKKGIRVYQYDQVYTILDTDNEDYPYWCFDQAHVLWRLEGTVFYVIYHSRSWVGGVAVHQVSVVFGLSSLLGNNGFLLEGLQMYFKDNPLENWYDDTYGIKWVYRESQWEDERDNSIERYHELDLNKYLLGQSKEWHDQVKEILMDQEIDLWLSYWEDKAHYRNHYGAYPLSWILDKVELVECPENINLVPVKSVDSNFWDIARIHHVYSVYVDKKGWHYNVDGFYDNNGVMQAYRNYFRSFSTNVASELKEWYPVQLCAYPLDLLSEAIGCYSQRAYDKVLDLWYKGNKER